jgi:hypothetical protein
MLDVVFYVLGAAILLVVLCAFSSTFNLLACLVMAAVTPVAALIEWLANLRSRIRKR